MTTEPTRKKRPLKKPKPPVRTIPEPRTPDELAPLGDDAFHGLAGEIVRKIEPHSEADPVAILVQFLAAFGNAMGRGPGFRVEANRHHSNLFIAIVGDTAMARKGTSLGQALHLMKQADPEWGERITSGASSGEGLIWGVRDPSEARGKQEADPGAVDKRLLVIETELASPLERMAVAGNTLSSVLRQAWDGDKLDTLVKTNRATATNAHISVIGHITAEELLRKLAATEQANGFANRFLWIYARRSKELPRSIAIKTLDWQEHLEQLQAALSQKKTQNVGMNEQAWRLWERIYGDLTTPLPGLLGATTARADAQVRRLALIYALLDRSSEVRPIHLRAALAIARHAADSAALLFGKSLGDPTADGVLAALRSNGPGLKRTDLSRHFAGHRTKEDLDRAIGLLVDQGLIREQKEDSRGGRPAIRLIATDAEAQRNKREMRGKS